MGGGLGVRDRNLFAKSSFLLSIHELVEPPQCSNIDCLHGTHAKKACQMPVATTCAGLAAFNIGVMAHDSQGLFTTSRVTSLALCSPSCPSPSNGTIIDIRYMRYSGNWPPPACVLHDLVRGRKLGRGVVRERMEWELNGEGEMHAR
jgi:hypothetical protein